MIAWREQLAKLVRLDSCWKLNFGRAGKWNKRIVEGV